MSLKKSLKDKTNPEIESVINAISNSGFYKEIRLEDVLFTIKESEIIKASKDLDDSIWKITNLRVDEKIGRIEINTFSDDFEKELLALMNPTVDSNLEKEEVQIQKLPSENIYHFIPNIDSHGDTKLLLILVQLIKIKLLKHLQRLL